MVRAIKSFLSLPTPRCRLLPGAMSAYAVDLPTTANTSGAGTAFMLQVRVGAQALLRARKGVVPGL